MSELILVFDLDDTLYPERQFALSGFAAAGRWAESELGLGGLAEDMTSLLDEGHLGELFRIALAGRLSDYTPEQLAGLVGAYRDPPHRFTGCVMRTHRTPSTTAHPSHLSRPRWATPT